MEAVELTGRSPTLVDLAVTVAGWAAADEWLCAPAGTATHPDETTLEQFATDPDRQLFALAGDDGGTVGALLMRGDVVKWMLVDPDRAVEAFRSLADTVPRWGTVWGRTGNPKLRALLEEIPGSVVTDDGEWLTLTVVR